MEHVFFARFHRPEDARGVLRDLQSSKVSIDVIGNELTRSSQDMPSGLSNVPRALMKGLIGGAVGGLLLGILFGVSGIGPPVPISAALATLFGAIAGALGAVLIGAQDPDQNLEKLASTTGDDEVILSFHVLDLTLEEQVVDHVRRFGGEIVPAAGMKTIDDPRR